MTTTEAVATPSPAAPKSARLSQLAIGSVALAVVATVLLAVVMHRVSSQTASNDRLRAAATASYLLSPNARAAQAAATTETTAALTFNYKTLQADFAKAEQGFTPGFRSTYEHTTVTSVQPLATQHRASVVATVQDSSVSAATATTATILVFVNQVSQNSQLAHPRLDRSRIKVSMVKINGRWLINNLSPI